MIYSDFQGIKLSLLGFGTMRLPLLPGGGDGDIDEVQVQAMTDYAMEHGVNYFDTAYPYHASRSELVIGRALARYPRESYYLADKFPGHQISETYDPEAVFEDQLRKCGVDYFDFYLLHNVNEGSIATYMDPRWGIVDYFREQRRLGRIRHLGFSCHAAVKGIEQFLDYCGEDMEFCQIQLNYLDWTLQDARGKYELLTERGIPVWVMEPLRGGKLARLAPEAEERLRAARPDENTPAWAFRFLQGLPNVKVVLSGMSSPEQMADNVRIFSERRPLSESEQELLLDVAEGLKNSVPCTACRYCCEGCPMQLDIPNLLAEYNELRVGRSVNINMRIEALSPDKRPDACIGCGQCARVCPQGMDVPGALSDFAGMLAAAPSWAEISRKRAEEAEAAKTTPDR